MHVRTPFGLRGTWRGLEWLVWQYILYVGVGRFDCTWWEGVTVTPPPIVWVMHARYHLPTLYSITISKLKFETYFEIIINGNFLRLMFVYTTSNIYLTPSLNFEIYILNLCEIVTNSWPKRNNVVDVYLTSRSKFWSLYVKYSWNFTYNWPRNSVVEDQWWPVILYKLTSNIRCSSWNFWNIYF